MAKEIIETKLKLLKPANTYKRILAYLIDVLIVEFIVFLATPINEQISSLTPDIILTNKIPQEIQSYAVQIGIALFIYFVLSEHLTKSTIGKLLLGLRVVNFSEYIAYNSFSLQKSKMQSNHNESNNENKNVNIKNKEEKNPYSNHTYSNYNANDENTNTRNKEFLNLQNATILDSKSIDEMYEAYNTNDISKNSIKKVKKSKKQENHTQNDKKERKTKQKTTKSNKSKKLNKKSQIPIIPFNQQPDDNENQLKLMPNIKNKLIKNFDEELFLSQILNNQLNIFQALGRSLFILPLPYMDFIAGLDIIFWVFSKHKQRLLEALTQTITVELTEEIRYIL